VATVFVPSQMRDLTGGVDRIEVPAGTLRQLLAAMEATHPQLTARLWDGESLLPGLSVSIDGAFSSRGLLAKVGPASEVHFLPAIGGG